MICQQAAFAGRVRARILAVFADFATLELYSL
jgi:hypothetical protein